MIAEQRRASQGIAHPRPLGVRSAVDARAQWGDRKGEPEWGPTRGHVRAGALGTRADAGRRTRPSEIVMEEMSGADWGCKYKSAPGLLAHS